MVQEEEKEVVMVQEEEKEVAMVQEERQNQVHQDSNGNARAVFFLFLSQVT
jgi:hypothetical protein